MKIENVRNIILAESEHSGKGSNSNVIKGNSSSKPNTPRPPIRPAATTQKETKEIISQLGSLHNRTLSSNQDI